MVAEHRTTGLTDGERRQLSCACRALSEGDSNLAIYCPRDLRVTEHRGLTDMAWSMYQHGTCTREVLWFIGKLLPEGEQPPNQCPHTSTSPNPFSPGTPADTCIHCLYFARKRKEKVPSDY